MYDRASGIFEGAGNRRRCVLHKHNSGEEREPLGPSPPPHMHACSSQSTHYKCAAMSPRRCVQDKRSGLKSPPHGEGLRGYRSQRKSAEVKSLRLLSLQNPSA